MKIQFCFFKIVYVLFSLFVFFYFDLPYGGTKRHPARKILLNLPCLQNNFLITHFNQKLFNNNPPRHVFQVQSLISL